VLSLHDFSSISSNFDYTTTSENQNVKSYENFESAKNILLIDSKNINERIDYLKSILNSEKVSYIYNNPKLNYFIKSVNIEKEILVLYNNSNDEVIIIDLDSICNLDIKLYESIIKIFLDSKCDKIGYNIKQDIRYFMNFRDDFEKFKDDIMIIYYLLDATRSDYLLEYILNDIFGIILKTEEKDNKDVQLDMFSALNDNESSGIKEIQISNLAVIVKAIYLSIDSLHKKLNDEEMMSLYQDIEMPLVITLASMEHIGMHVNREKIEVFDREISKRIEELTLKIYEIANEEFNINSTKQLGTILFEKLGLKGGRKIKTGSS